MEFQATETKVEANVPDGTIEWNEGKNGGMVLLKKCEANLESLKSYCEALKTAVASGLGAVGAGPAANGATGASAFNTAMASALINFEDMENTKIVQ